MIVADYVNASRLPGKKKQLKKYGTRTVTQRWQIPPGVGAVEYVNDVMTLGVGESRLDVYKSGAGRLGRAHRQERLLRRLVHRRVGREEARCRPVAPGGHCARRPTRRPS